MTASPLVAAISRALREHLTPADRLLLACSGGLDSMALLAVLTDHVPADFALQTRLAIAHVNYHIHANANTAENLVREAATRAGVPTHIAHGPVFVPPGESFEAVARDFRYDFLAATAASIGATLVLTAHTLDDQAETVLMMLLDGTGVRGLRGIPVRRALPTRKPPPTVEVWRPMLGITRADVRAFVEAHGIAFADDPTNADESIFRNRVRHTILPFLADHGNARVREHLADLAADVRAEVEFTEAQISAVVANALVVGEVNGETVAEFFADRVPPDWPRSRLPAVLLAVLKTVGLAPRRISRRILTALAELLSTAHSASPRQFDLPQKWRAEITPGRIRFSPAASVTSSPPPVPTTFAETAVMAPGRTEFAAFAVPMALIVREVAISPAMLAAFKTDPSPACERLTIRDASRFPLRLRARREGDRIQPLGAPGSRSLKEVFRQHAIAADRRNRWPLLVDARDAIVWVVGLCVADDVRIAFGDASANENGEVAGFECRIEILEKSGTSFAEIFGIRE